MCATPVVRKVLQAITFHNLCRPGERLVVDCRGDAAGIALVHALADLGPECGYPLTLTVAHLLTPLSVDPTDTDETAQAVAQLARERGLEARLERLDVGPQDANGRSSQRRAQQASPARRHRLARVAAEVGAPAVAEATCADDRAEAALTAIIAGTSPADLAGPPIKEPLPGTPAVLLIRPLWHLWTADLERDLRHRGLDPAEIPRAPLGNEMHRRVREDLLPLLEERYNRRIREALLRLANSAAAPEET